jgi:hypothetical protein
MALLILEWLGFLALMSTGEINNPIVIFPLVAFFVGKKVVLSEKILLPFVFCIFPAAYLVFLYTHWHPIVVASHFILIAFATFYLQKPTPRIEAFRMASLFLMGLLASSLSPELHTGVLVLLIVTSLIGLFFEKSLKRHSPNHNESIVPKPSKIWTLLIVLVLIIISIMIYPFLPRAQWGVSGQSGFGFSTTGFSGDVNLNASQRFESASRKVSLRFYLGDNLKPRDIYKIFPEGLIPLRRLEVFDGQSWYSKTRPKFQEYSSDSINTDANTPTLDVIAEPQSYSALVSSLLQNEIKNLRTDTGDKLVVRKDPISENLTFKSPFKRRTHYTLAFSNLDLNTILEKVHFPPTEINLYTQLPKEVRNSPFFKNLKNSVLSSPSQIPSDSVNAIDLFFKKENFKWSLDSPKENTISGIHLIRDFIKNKSGHCELYATTAAILLRMQNIPTRLVTGYRIQNIEKNVFAAFDKDAHSWVEYFDGLSWKSFDPTPTLTAPPNWWEQISYPIEELGFTMSSLWYKEFVNVDPTQSKSLIFDWRNLKNLLPITDLKWNTNDSNTKSESDQVSGKIEVQTKIFAHNPIFISFLIISLVGIGIFYLVSNSQVNPLKNPILFLKHTLILFILRREKCSSLLELKMKLKHDQESKIFKFLKSYERSRFFTSNS